MRTILCRLLLLLWLGQTPGALRPPIIQAHQTVKFVDQLTSTSRMAISGKGLGYTLPAPTTTDFSHTAAMRITFETLDAQGQPTRLLLKYDADGGGASRSVDIQLTGDREVVTGDGKVLDDRDRKSALVDAHRVLDSLTAITAFSALPLIAGQSNEVDPEVMRGLLGLSPGQLRRARITRRAGGADNTYDLTLVVAPPNDHGDPDVEMSGTLAVKQDWSMVDARVNHKTSEESVSGDLQVRWDTTWSLTVTRRMEW
jgi:hypothetical protein